MKVDLTQQILNLHGRPIQDQEGDLRVRRVLQVALLAELPEDVRSKTEVLKRYQLARVLERWRRGPYELNADQVKMLGDRITQAWPPVVSGFVVELLDPALADAEPVALHESRQYETAEGQPADESREGEPPAPDR